MVRASMRPWPRSTVQASPAKARQGSASAASNSFSWLSPMVKMKKAPGGVDLLRVLALGVHLVCR